MTLRILGGVLFVGTTVFTVLYARYCRNEGIQPSPRILMQIMGAYVCAVAIFVRSLI